MITAAHCLTGFDSNLERHTFRSGTKFNETIEIKRKYVHPNYIYPKNYNDIALLELGRRIHYDFDLVRETGLTD